jgi:hypothetical protein
MRFFRRVKGNSARKRRLRDRELPEQALVTVRYVCPECAGAHARSDCPKRR